MPRRSNRGKDLTPATIVDSDDDFIAVVLESDDQYVVFFFIAHILLIYILFSILRSADGKDVNSESDIVQEIDEDEGDQGQDHSRRKNNSKVIDNKKVIAVHDSESEDA
jgi:hypothetical protein